MGLPCTPRTGTDGQLTTTAGWAGFLFISPVVQTPLTPRYYRLFTNFLPPYPFGVPFWLGQHYSTVHRFAHHVAPHPLPMTTFLQNPHTFLHIWVCLPNAHGHSLAHIPRLFPHITLPSAPPAPHTHCTHTPGLPVHYWTIPLCHGTLYASRYTPPLTSPSTFTLPLLRLSTCPCMDPASWPSLHLYLNMFCSLCLLLLRYLLALCFITHSPLPRH